MDDKVLHCLRALRKALCPNGMVALQIGNIGDLPDTDDKEARITFVNDMVSQYVTLSDDEWECPEGLVTEIVDMILEQREEHERARS